MSLLVRAGREPRLSVVGARPALVGPHDKPTLTIRVTYTGVRDSRLPSRNLRAHVWTDAVPLPQCDGGYCVIAGNLWEDIAVGQEQTIPMRAGTHMYVSVFEDRAADDDGTAHPVAVQGERRAQAVINLEAVRSGTTVVAKLLVSNTI